MKYAHPDRVVTTDFVQSIMHDTDNYRIIEADENPLLYAAGHIPNAAQIDWFAHLLHPVWRDLVAPEDFAKLCIQLGITPETTVIFYGDQSNWWACHAFWVFTYFGHKKCCIMDGGRAKWFNERRPIAWEVPQFSPTSYPVPKVNHSIRALRDDVLAHVARGGKLIDVRSKPEYDGFITHSPDYPKEAALRAGHIPGAINMPWSTAVNQHGTFKSADELYQLYCDKGGLNPEDEVIVYCRIGERSSHTWFVLTYLLGFRSVRNYDGSWTEWGNMIGVPIERSTQVEQVREQCYA
ncbi:MAG: sulfurtransferase [Candidatus Kapabacteria bacterium]|nr:sulfurtransferase [Candidatus Kapabacteria bacterium]